MTPSDEMSSSSSARARQYSANCVRDTRSFVAICCSELKSSSSFDAVARAAAASSESLSPSSARVSALAVIRDGHARAVRGGVARRREARRSRRDGCGARRNREVLMLQQQDGRARSLEMVLNS